MSNQLNFVVTKEFANDYAKKWIEAWNTNDLDQVLGHYSEDFKMSSPLISKITGENIPTLEGKEKVGAYWKKALSMASPKVHFTLETTLVGAMSITILYKNQNGRVAEVITFNNKGEAIEGNAHYA